MEPLFVHITIADKPHMNIHVYLSFKLYLLYAVGCRYDAVQYRKVFYEWLQELMQNINQKLDPQKTPHT